MKLTKEEVTALLFDVYFHLPKESASIGEKLRHHMDASEKEVDDLKAEREVFVSGIRHSDEQHSKDLVTIGELLTEIADLRERLREIAELTNHQIPIYAYGDSEAGCEMSSRLREIFRLTEKED